MFSIFFLKWGIKDIKNNNLFIEINGFFLLVVVIFCFCFEFIAKETKTSFLLFYILFVITSTYHSSIPVPWLTRKNNLKINFFFSIYTCEILNGKYFQSSYLSSVNRLFNFCFTDLTWGKWAYKRTQSLLKIVLVCSHIWVIKL